ncbi:MAG: hypothetical protein NT129_00600 [Candidatus Aenigmarchaeota archaeon]|nr:hypothetical protein [Candidatus Aenigmarchaeota archaeon]
MPDDMSSLKELAEVAKRGLLEFWEDFDKKLLQRYGSDYLQRLYNIAQGKTNDPSWVSTVGVLTRKEAYLNLSVELAESLPGEDKHIRNYAVFGWSERQNDVMTREQEEKYLSAETKTKLEKWRKNLQLNQIKFETIGELRY